MGKILYLFISAVQSIASVVFAVARPVDLVTAGVYAGAQALCSAGKEIAYDLA